jgi:hypothetical protein
MWTETKFRKQLVKSDVGQAGVFLIEETGRGKRVG